MPNGVLDGKTAMLLAINTHRKPWPAAVLAGVVRLVMAAAAAQVMIPAVESPAPVFTKIGPIRKLSRAEADKHYPVRIRGVITLYLPASYQVFVQDDTGGIYLQGAAELNVPMSTGSEVEITGVTAEGGFAPVLDRLQVKVLGRKPLPKPHWPTSEELGTGQLDDLYVAVEGVVHSVFVQEDPRPGVRGLHVLVTTEEGPVHVVIRGFKGAAPESFIGAHVRVRGAMGSSFNTRGQLTSDFLSVESLNSFEVLASKHEDPYALPAVPMSHLLEFHYARDRSQRVRVRGVLTLIRPGDSVVLQDSGSGLLVSTQERVNLPLGTLVDAVGFQALGPYGPMLENALVRLVVRGAPPQPVPVTAAQAASGDHDYQLVTIKATLVAQLHGRDRQVVWLRAGDSNFSAILEGQNSNNSIDDLRNGSLVALTGICTTLTSDVFKEPIGFRMLLRSPADIGVLSTPPWWEDQRVFWVFGAASALALIILAWNMVLRRRVKLQTDMIARQFRQEAALEGRYRDLFEQATDFICRHDVKGRILSLNRSAEVLLGVNRDLAKQRTLLDFVAPHQRAQAVQLLSEIASGVEMRSFELEMKGANGIRAVLEIRSHLVTGEDGEVWIESFGRDVTERCKRAVFETDRNEVLEMVGRNEGLPAVLDRVRRLTERQLPNTACAIMLVENGVMHCAASQGVAAELIRRIVDGGIGPTSSSGGSAAYWGRPIVAGDIATDPLWAELRDEALRDGWRACWSTPILSATGGVLGTLDVFHRNPRQPHDREITLMDSIARLTGNAIEHGQIYERLTRQSQQDSLTGIPNRIVLEDRLTQALLQAQRYGNRVACLYIDLDGFKQVNDTLGHKVGDMVLQAAVSRMKAVIRASDTLARIGGDEFIIVMPGVEGLDQAETVARKLVETLGSSPILPEFDIEVGASVGISVSPDHGTDTVSLQRNADTAMYHAKRSGKSRYAVYTPSRDAAADLSCFGPPQESLSGIW